MHDVRLACRSLLATPIVSIAAALSLALGMGANTAIFSLVSSVMLRTLPVADPQRLAIVTSGASANREWSYAIWDALRRRAQEFDGAIAWAMRRFNLAQRGEVLVAEGVLVSGDFFTVLGVPPLLGRTFTPADDTRGGGPDGAVAVISYAFWQRHFGGAANAIGAPLTVEGKPFTVVGVTPPDFFGTEVGRWFDVAVPIGTEPIMRGRVTALDQPANFWLNVMVRLKPGRSLNEATAALRGAQPQIRAAAMPPGATANQQAGFMRDPFALTEAAAGLSGLRRQYERPLLTLLVVAALVLLVACANIANLLLARASARRHELSVRLALGAPHWRLARQLFVESLVLAGAGAAAGLLFAHWGSRMLVAQLSTAASAGGPVALDLSIDGHVLAFTAAMTMATALLFGTAPAFRAARVAPIDALKEYRGAASGAGIASGLVVVQVALSLVLVVAAGLFVRTFIRLAATPLGFDEDRVLVANINSTRSTAPQETRLALYQRIADAVAAVPGIARASGSLVTPVSGSNWAFPLDVAGAPPLSDGDRNTQVNFVSPGWFATYGMTIVAGRDFDVRDGAGAPPVAIVNETFAARFFPGRSAIGGVVAFPAAANASAHAPRTIVGVTSDAVYRSLRDPQRPAMYEPLAQNDWPFPLAGIALSVRSTSGSPMRLTRSVAAAITAVDPNLAFSFRPLADQINASLSQERLLAILSGFFGGLAMLLAGLGLYGITAHAVSQRRIEIGIRMALGAAPAGIVRLVLSRVSLLVTAGVIVGAGVSLGLARFVASLLYGLDPRDPVTLAGAVATLVIVGTLAGWLPARRASLIDPAQVLRDA